MFRYAAVLVAGLCLATGVARAQFYFQGEVGYASAQFALDEPYNGVVDDRSVMLGVNGGLRIGKRWAIETGLNRYSGFDGRATPCPHGAVCTQAVIGVSDSGLAIFKIAAVPTIALGKFRLFGRAGYYRAKIDTKLGLPGDRFTERGAMLGAGLRWYFKEPWTVSLEATRFDDKIYQLGAGFGWGMGSSE